VVYRINRRILQVKGKNKKIPKLETERLILKELTRDDSKALFEHWSNEEVTKFMNIEPFSTVAEVISMIDLLNNLFEKDEAIRWGIFKKDTKELIGTCGFNSGLGEENFIGEIGYELGRKFWGKGFMKEALNVVIRYGFNTLNLNRIEAYVMLNNEKSSKLLEQLGFHREGILREYGCYKGRFWDEYIFSLLKRDKI